ncbi:hypothetical protein JNW90_27100 [Micromonospora sp. STR1s_5]|nr:hypothetical protein [Micromonospora sp. STR1s_5]
MPVRVDDEAGPGRGGRERRDDPGHLGGEKLQEGAPVPGRQQEPVESRPREVAGAEEAGALVGPVERRHDRTAWPAGGRTVPVMDQPTRGEDRVTRLREVLKMDDSREAVVEEAGLGGERLVHAGLRGKDAAVLVAPRGAVVVHEALPQEPIRAGQVGEPLPRGPSTGAHRPGDDHLELVHEGAVVDVQGVVPRHDVEWLRVLRPQVDDLHGAAEGVRDERDQQRMSERLPEFGVLHQGARVRDVQVVVQRATAAPGVDRRVVRPPRGVETLGWDEPGEAERTLGREVPAQRREGVPKKRAARLRPARTVDDRFDLASEPRGFPLPLQLPIRRRAGQLVSRDERRVPRAHIAGLPTTNVDWVRSG